MVLLIYGALLQVESKQGDGPERKVTRLAIGLEGGFDPDNAKNYEISETNSIVLLPDFSSIPWPCESLPQPVSSYKYFSMCF